LAKVIFPNDLQKFTGGVKDTEVSACNYRGLVTELRQQFPALTDEIVMKYSMAIDGIIIPKPLLETFGNDSKLVFFGRIAAG
jgi:hypothetical protein